MASTPVSAAVTFGRDVLADQLDLLAGVKSGELKLIAGDLILQLGQQRQPCRREVAALVINDPSTVRSSRSLTVTGDVMLITLSLESANFTPA